LWGAHSDSPNPAEDGRTPSRDEDPNTSPSSSALPPEGLTFESDIGLRPSCPTTVVKTSGPSRVVIKRGLHHPIPKILAVLTGISHPCDLFCS
jgi:hypothetical protein